MKKKSLTLLAITLGLVVLLVVSYSFYVKDQLTPRDEYTRQIWLIGSGPFFTDTLDIEYKHLVSDFPVLELDPNKRDEVIIEGYANGRGFAEWSISNDSLIISYRKIKEDTIIVSLEDESPLKVIVGSKDLHSIVLKNEGRIDHPVRPFGADTEGRSVYDPGQWEEYALTNERLEIHLLDGASANLLVEVGQVNLYIENREPVPSSNYYNLRGPGISLVGNARKVTLIDPKGHVNISGRQLEVDSLEVIDLPHRSWKTTGAIQLNCGSFLRAELNEELDILYSGQPEVVSMEKGYGRVIKAN